MTDAYVTAAKRQRLAAEMRRLGIGEDALVEKFVLGSGPGGQKVNKTSSCVYLQHRPSGVEVKCSRTRSRELNRFLARRELCERIAERLRGEETARRQKAEKIRRQKRRRSRRQKAAMLAQKRKQSEKKQRRRPVTAEQ